MRGAGAGAQVREDQKGAAESLRIMVEHESTLRTAASTRPRWWRGSGATRPRVR